MTNAEFFTAYSNDWFIEKAADFIREPEPRRLYEPVPQRKFHGPHKGCFFTDDGLEPCGKWSCPDCRDKYSA